MIKVLKAMLSDIAPKSWKSVKDGLILFLILAVIFSIMMIAFSFLASIVALVLNISSDAAVFLVFAILGLIAWAYDAYERTK